MTNIAQKQPIIFIIFKCSGNHKRKMVDNKQTNSKIGARPVFLDSILILCKPRVNSKHSTISLFGITNVYLISNWNEMLPSAGWKAIWHCICWPAWTSKACGSKWTPCREWISHSMSLPTNTSNIGPLVTVELSVLSAPSSTQSVHTATPLHWPDLGRGDISIKVR